MKEYTLKQVIDKFERNSNLKFKFLGNEDYKAENGVIIHLDNFDYVVNEEGESILSNFSLRDRFILLNQSVDIVVAFKAFSKGKTIYCECHNDRLHYKAIAGSGLTAVENIENQKPVSVEEILYGKWFIEEEEQYVQCR